MMGWFLPLLNNSFFLLLIRYGIVGVVASLFHGIISYSLVEFLHIDFMIAHFVGFIFGTITAYLGHYFYSFKDQRNHKQLFFKFLLISVIAFFIHEFGAYFLVTQAHFNYKSQVLPFLLVVVPVFTFVLNRFWVFSNSPTFK